ncbi:cutinase family protein [Rhodococcus hoagii]|nr:cutinase family protein [Prescottella equi]
MSAAAHGDRARHDRIVRGVDAEGRHRNSAQVILPVLSEFGGGSEGAFDRTYVPYPADYGFQGTPYEQSYRQGVQNTLKVIGDIATSCPKTKVGVMGYSQAAMWPRRCCV